MAINVFEGGRRVARLFMALWAVGAIVAFWAEDRLPVEATFVVAQPNATPVRTDADCARDDRQEFNWGTTKRGAPYQLRMCFSAGGFPREVLKSRQPAPSGPYTAGELLQAHKNALAANDATAAEELLRAAARRTIDQNRNFAPSVTDERWIDSQHWRALWKHVISAARWVLGGVLAIWVTATTVGWIVRGFLGVPTGSDKRPDSAAG